MIWIARFALAVSAVLSVLFDPRVFFGGGQGGGGFISFASWFHAGSWWATRLAVAALVLYGIAALSGDGGARTPWRGPAVALALIAWGSVRGMPHRDNQRSWARGDVGALAWVRTQRDHRAGERTTIGPDAFAGVWRGADGTEWTFTPNAATRVIPAARAQSPAAVRALCRGTFRAAYEQRGRAVFAESGIDSSAHARALARTFGERARFPVATVGCTDDPWTADFVRVSDDELWLLEPWMTNDEMRADAFIYRRVAAPPTSPR